MRRPGLGGLALAAVAALATAGCGVPSDHGPRALSRSDVPFGLLAPSTTAATAPGGSTATLAVTVFLVAGNRLVGAPRAVAPPAGVSRALGALLLGPTPAESAAGFRTAITDQTRLLGLKVQQGVATIDLSGGFAGVSGQEQILALAQIVFTATGDPTVASVLFALDDKPVEVPRGDGTLTAAGLTRNDFAAFAPA